MHCYFSRQGHRVSLGTFRQGHTAVGSVSRITVLTLCAATILAASGCCGQALNNPGLILYSKVHPTPTLTPEMDSVSLQPYLSSKLLPGFRGLAQTAPPLEGKQGSGPDYPIASQQRYQALDSCLVHPRSQPEGSSSLPVYNCCLSMQGLPNIWRHQRGQEKRD